MPIRHSFIHYVGDGRGWDPLGLWRLPDQRHCQGGEEVGAVGGGAGDALQAQRAVGRAGRPGDQQQPQQVRPRAQFPREAEPQQNQGTTEHVLWKFAILTGLITTFCLHRNRSV